MAVQRDGRGAHGRVVPQLRSTAVATLLVVAVLIALSAAATPLLHSLQRVAGWTATPKIEAAWFVNPSLMDKGFNIDRPNAEGVQFDIQLGPLARVPWTAMTGRHVIASGIARGVGTTELEEVPPSLPIPGWLVISIRGIQTPLKIWVHT